MNRLSVAPFYNMSKHTNELLALLVIGLTVRVGYILAFPYSYSFDVLSWDKVGDLLLAGGNPYHFTHCLNWPPFWMQLVFLFKKISLATHLPFHNVVQGFLMIAESVLAWLLYAAVKQDTEFKTPARLLMYGIAINPVAIFQVCQHCNFNVLVGFWVLLAVYMLFRFQERHESRFWLLACFALGMGSLAKTVPLSLTPLLLLSVRKLKRIEQMLGMVLLLGPIILALSIVYVLGPEDIEKNVFGYRSIPGFFGLTGLFAYWGAARLLAIYPCSFEIIYGIGWICLGAWLLLKETLDKKRIISVAVVILLAIPALGPGYGPQYVYWFLPLLVLMYALADRKIRFFLMILYGVGMATYLIEYALLPDQGACLFSIVPPGGLLKIAAHLSSATGQTFLRLPLWIMYCILVAFLCATIGNEMARDFRQIWLRRREQARLSSSQSG